MYRAILENYKNKAENPMATPLRCLACIVFNADKILVVMVGFPRHDFSKLPILHDRPLLDELKKYVTIEPTEGVMVNPTGIPPHIGLATQLKDILATLSKLVGCFQSQSETLIESVEKALEKKSWENGHITGSRLKEILDEFHGSINQNRGWNSS